MDAAYFGAYFIRFPYKMTHKMKKKREQAETTIFSAEFYAHKADKANLSITAHARYKLFINRQLVCCGPAKGFDDTLSVDDVDISDLLVDGTNRIVVYVVSYPSKVDLCKIVPPFSVYSSGDAPYLFVKGAVISETGITDLSTGHYPWYAAIDESITHNKNDVAVYLGGTECFYAEKRPALLNITKNPYFFLAENVFCYEQSEYGEKSSFVLKKRSIPMMYCRSLEIDSVFDETGNEIQINDYHVLPNTTRSLIIDAGQLETAFVKIQASGSGGYIKITYAECYVKQDKDGTLIKGRRDDRSGVIIGSFDEYFTFELSEYEPFWFRTFRYIKLEISTGKEELIINKMELTETGYPLENKTAVEFEDKWLDTWWEINIRTLQRCMHETYEDCPYYEQVQYVLDSRLEALFTYALSGDVRLAMKSANEFHSSAFADGMISSRYPCQKRQVIPSFSLHYILMIYDLAVETGDLKALSVYLPTIDGILNWYILRMDNGLIGPSGNWEFIDWVEEWKDTLGVPSGALTGISVTHNLMLSYALKIASRINKLYKFKDKANYYMKFSEKINKIINLNYYIQENSMYCENEAKTEFAQHTQIFAVLSGCAKDELAIEIMENAMNSITRTGEKVLKCSFPMQFYLFRALEETNLYHLSNSIFDSWRKLLSYNITTIPETENEPRSDCHGWSALMLYECPRVWLGVQYDMISEKLILSPKPCGISLSGTVCTPFGTVSASVVDTETEFNISYRIPEGITATLILPDRTEFEITDEYSCILEKAEIVSENDTNSALVQFAPSKQKITIA